MSGDLIAYMFEQLEEHINDLEDELQGDDNNKVMYHTDKIKSLTEKLKSACMNPIQ